MAEWPARGQQAPNFWDTGLRAYIDAISDDIPGASGAPTLVVNRVAADLNLTCDKTGATDAAPAWQATLDMAGGSGFGAIRVVAEPGTYLVRNLNPKSGTHIDLTGVTLQHGGARAGSTVEGSTATIYGNGSSGSITGLRITGGTIRGIRVDYTNVTGPGGNEGVYLYLCPGAVVEGVTFTENGQDACTFHDSDGAKFLRNTVTNNGDAAVELRAGGNYEVVGNTFTKVRNAVASKPNVTDVRVDSNQMTTFEEGVVLHGSRWRITRNTILPTSADAMNAATSTAHAIRYADDWSSTIPTNSGSDILVEGNTISGRAGAAALFFTTLSGATTLKRVAFKNNSVVGCNRGVQNAATAVSDLSVSGNQMTATDRGVWAAAGSGWTIENNQITTTANPGVESLVPGAIIRGNSVVSSTVAGIRTTAAATDNVIEGNTVVASGGAGLLLAGAGAVVGANRISTASGAAISLSAANAAVSGNRLAATSGEAILLGAGSTGSVVTGNIGTSGTHGARVSASDCTIIGNRLTGAQFWGINISAGVTGTLQGSNMLKGNTSGAITDAGSGTILSGANIAA